MYRSATYSTLKYRVERQMSSRQCILFLNFVSSNVPLGRLVRTSACSFALSEITKIHHDIYDIRLKATGLRVGIARGGFLILKIFAGQNLKQCAKFLKKFCVIFKYFNTQSYFNAPL